MAHEVSITLMLIHFSIFTSITMFNPLPLMIEMVETKLNNPIDVGCSRFLEPKLILINVGHIHCFPRKLVRVIILSKN